jgi:hypothetical protein
MSLLPSTSSDPIDTKNISELDEILALPALPSGSSDDNTRQITLGETLKLDELGPIIINTGTT